ncbi:hypothetical protein HYC85_029272 [Camellia sinensis]|uniref:Uncharacterized protein n=1 Tax=Camellia sinensis TaxID=4442 RepID=A0A7J7FYR9_CAMSI|nr:hypothetical protein HYC85_029272 [Camellia sinensis]
MVGVTEDPPVAIDETTHGDDLTLANMLGKETIAARRALNFDSPTTSAQETMQAVMEQAKQNEQRLQNMIAENERLRQDLALEIAKSREAMRQETEQPPRAGGQQPRARPKDTDSDSNSLPTEINKKGRSETSSSSEKSLHTRNKRRRSSSNEEDQHDPFVRRIARVTLPKKFKAPSFTLYDGKLDPTDHIRHYK